MALISPSGIATTIAMIAPMKMVPQKSGIAPKAPDEPAWSARMAVCGLQLRPVKNSTGETIEKKRSDSNSSDRTRPNAGSTARRHAARPERDRRDHREEAERFEQQRQDDAQSRQHRDQRRDQQCAHHQPFDTG